MKQSRSFTFIELIVVISILILFSGIVTGSLNIAREKGRIEAGRSFESQAYHVAAEQVVGIWEFDECSGTVLKDRSGFGRDGTLVNGAAFSSDTPSRQGCSLSLDGIDDYVNISDSVGDFSFRDASPFTVSFWLRQKLPDPAAHYGRILSKEALSGGRQGWDISWTSATMLSFERWKDNVPATLGLVTSADDSWHQFIYSFDGSKMYLYRDGRLTASANSSLLIVAHVEPLRIGAASTGGSISSLSLVDNVRIYAKSLSASEAQELYVWDSSQKIPVASK